MSEIDIATARRTAACIAFRHINDVSEREREHVLVALMDVLPEREGKLAQDALFALRESRRLQLELHALVEGVGQS